jgi:hypothetical protein
MVRIGIYIGKETKIKSFNSTWKQTKNDFLGIKKNYRIHHAELIVFFLFLISLAKLKVGIFRIVLLIVGVAVIGIALDDVRIVRVVVVVGAVVFVVGVTQCVVKTESTQTFVVEGTFRRHVVGGLRRFFGFVTRLGQLQKKELLKKKYLFMKVPT